MYSSRQAPPAPAVVLFDIDGTLLRRSGPHHRQALVDAIGEVAGLETTTDNVPVQGMLDRKIMEMMLANAGVDTASARLMMPQLTAAAQRIYLRRCPDSLRHRVCPGVRGVLERLRRRGVPLGLVTGNLSHIGWKKISLAGLRRYFEFGAFAEQAEDRAGLVRIALRHAAQQNWTTPGGRRATPVWLIGDHENDVLAAKANRIGSIAVATGLSSADQLRRCAPDFVFPNLGSLNVEMLLR